MANRTGTYLAFDGLGKTNPTESDFKYYASLQAWSAGKNIDFKLLIVMIKPQQFGITVNVAHWNQE